MTTTTIAEDPHPGAGTLYVHGKTQSRLSAPITWEEISKIREEPFYLSTPDVLLERGIGEYTFIPGTDSILGKGKFSTVYKVIGPDGDYYALKHTPLYPHHPLIAARLLREPTLLAQLPPHPNLIGVQGMKRTEGHFYLIEQYASHHAPLPAHPLPLAPSRAAYILDQLVSVIRDCLHKSRVCHRDLKGENVLVDQESGDVLILDLGLATHFSASAPKLTTCCGSPAFHSPEIVTALAHPPGVITYYGPELDIWCIALTLLSLLLRLRFPLGPHHTHHSIMRSRALDRLQELDELYPPTTPYLHIPNSQYLTQSAKDHEVREWKRVRRAMRDFLEIDGKKRMRKFEEYQIGQQVQKRVKGFEGDVRVGVMKSTSFLPTEIKYTLPLYLEDRHLPVYHEDIQSGRLGPLVLDNPTGMKERKVLSYIRYLLRSAGIGYHCLQRSMEMQSDIDTDGEDHQPNSGGKSHENIYQLVLSYPQTSETISQIPSRERDQSPNAGMTSSPKAKRSGSPGWVNALSLNPFKRPQPSRSVSVPSKPRTKATSQATTSGASTDPAAAAGGKKRWLRTWIRIEIIDEVLTLSPPSSSHGHGHGNGHGQDTPAITSRSSSRTRVDSLTPLITSHHLPDMTGLSFSSTGPGPVSTPHPHPHGQGQGQGRRPSPSPRRKTTSDRYCSTAKPSPLSRQVSPELSYTNPSVDIPASVSRASSSSGRTRVSNHSSSTNHHSNPIIRRSRIIIHSSDERCYPALKAALDIKHSTHRSEYARKDTYADGEETANSSSNSTAVSPVIIQQNQLQPLGHQEEQRGRPRSKESAGTSPSVLDMIDNARRNERERERNAQAQTQEPEVKEMQVGIQVVEEQKKQNKRRESKSRNRKTGFWSLFASVDGHSLSHRSISMPPSRETLT